MALILLSFVVLTKKDAVLPPAYPRHPHTISSTPEVSSESSSISHPSLSVLCTIPPSQLLPEFYIYYSLQASILISHTFAKKTEWTLSVDSTMQMPVITIALFLNLQNHYVATDWRSDTHLLHFCSKTPQFQQSSAFYFPTLGSLLGRQLP